LGSLAFFLAAVVVVVAAPAAAAGWGGRGVRRDGGGGTASPVDDKRRRNSSSREVSSSSSSSSSLFSDAMMNDDPLLLSSFHLLGGEERVLFELVSFVASTDPYFQEMMFSKLSLGLNTALAMVASGVEDRRHLNIAPDQSIAHEVLRSNASRNNIFGGESGTPTKPTKPTYKLHAEKAWGGDYSIHVKETTPAVTSFTTTSTNGGQKQQVNEDDMAALLVADPHSDGEINTMAVIAVDKTTESVHGIIDQGGGEKMNFIQEKGKKVGASVQM
jgi:hypothetical protein